MSERISDARLAELAAHWTALPRMEAWQDITSALRELAELREQVRWRPMEEAPKDGAKILVRSPTNNVYVAMRGGSAGGAIGNWLTTPGAWLVNNPTGWMPLPEIGPLPGGDA